VTCVTANCAPDRLPSAPRRLTPAERRRQPVVVAVRRTVFDRHVLSLDLADLSQALPNREPLLRGECPIEGYAVEIADDRQPLRAGRKRPCRYRAAKKGDELAPPHAALPTSLTTAPYGLKHRLLALSVSKPTNCRFFLPGLMPFSSARKA
jgi:hypothetical protein